MSRRSEIMQMEIQREFCNAMLVLREIWDEIGIPDDQVTTRGNTVLMHIRNLLNEMISEEKNLKAAMISKIEKHETELLDLTLKLHLPPYEQQKGTTIMQREKELRTQVAHLNKIKRDRVSTLASLQSIEQELCDQLYSTPCYIASGTIPTEEQLKEIEDHIETLQAEKARRKELFATKKAEIVSLYDELNIIPESSFAQDIITDELDSFSLSKVKMDELEKLRKSLNLRKSEAQQQCDFLWSEIKSLWLRLETDQSVRDEAKRQCPGISHESIEKLKKVLNKLKAEKLENLQKLTEAARSQIGILWDKCFYSAEQRQQFLPASDENYTEELLEEHEEELTRLHAYYEEHQHLFENVKKWQDLFRRMLDLESNARDINRFSNRGGKLLQEERERKRIHSKLPKIEEELFGHIERWEENSGKPFLVEGTRFSDFIHLQWEACEKRKENEKQVRLEKKQQELQTEMAFGSIPKTPTKRRFIGTTTILKTPTDSAKKPRTGAMNSTTRSVMPTGNCTAATYYSPGKPPVSSRLRTPNKHPIKARIPLAKRALIENKANPMQKAAKTGPTSIRSAPSPDLDTTFIKSLSTTVVSSNAAASIKSMPEVNGTPYCDFAAEINSNLKENKVLRSSAVNDYPRV